MSNKKNTIIPNYLIQLNQFFNSKKKLIFFIKILNRSINHLHINIGPRKNFKFAMNQEIQQMSAVPHNRHRFLGVERQGNREFFVFRRGNFFTPTVEDTPKYYPQGAPSTLLVRQPYAAAIIVPRNLNFEFHNE